MKKTRKLTLATTLIALAGLLSIPAAAAAERQLTGDPAGDAASPAGSTLAAGEGDLRRVVLDRNEKGMLRFVILTQAETDPDSVYINLQAGKQMFQMRRGRIYRVRSFAIEGGPASDRGFARVLGRDDRIVVTISPTVLGGPRVLRWQVEVLAGLDRVDAVPDSGLRGYRLAGDRALLRGPARVRPGARTSFGVSGLPARTELTVHLQPSANRGGNGAGVLLPRRYRTNAKGRAALRFRFPSHYFRCLGKVDCSPQAWRRGSRADVNVCTVGGSDIQCLRRVVKIR